MDGRFDSAGLKLAGHPYVPDQINGSRPALVIRDSGSRLARWTRLAFICAALLSSDFACAEQWLALTLAPDGTWGAAAGDNTDAAMAGAIAQCAKRSPRPPTSINGCGASLRLARDGWGIAEICGTYWLVSVEPTHDEAELSLRAWKLSMKYQHGIALPECRRVVTVGPDGEPAEYQP